MVVQSDGTLVEVPDEAYKARRVRQVPGSEELWRSWYWRFRRHRPGKSLSQAWGGFCKEHWERFHCEPPRTLKLMPRLENNWFMPVGTLTLEELL